MFVKVRGLQKKEGFLRGFGVKIDLVVNKRREEEIEEEAMASALFCFEESRNRETKGENNEEKINGLL